MELNGAYDIVTPTRTCSAARAGGFSTSRWTDGLTTNYTTTVCFNIDNIPNLLYQSCLWCILQAIFSPYKVILLSRYDWSVHPNWTPSATIFNMNDAELPAQPSLFRYVLGFLAVGIAWGLTTPVRFATNPLVKEVSHSPSGISL
jgi:hypothetical protein